VRRRHTPIEEPGQWLRRVVDGYLNYHAVPTNSVAIGRFRTEVMLSRLALTDRAWFGETDRDLGVIGVGELGMCGVTGLVRPS
jgi:hypothetical protein